MSSNSVPLARVTLELARASGPIRGFVTVGAAEPSPFWGWLELRAIVDASLGHAPGGLPALTSTERRIVSLLCEGLSNPQIAELLVTSPRTVQGHLYRVFKKVGVRTRAELVSRWLRIQTDPEKPAQIDLQVESLGSRDRVLAERTPF